MNIAGSGDMVASNQRPIPLRKRSDLVVAKIDYLGVGYQVIKDPVALKYHRLQMEQFRILELLNGVRSLEEVRDDLKKDFPTLQISLNDIQQLITDLHRKGLVISNRSKSRMAVRPSKIPASCIHWSVNARSSAGTRDN